MKQIILFKASVNKEDMKFTNNEEVDIENSCLEETPKYIQRLFYALVDEIFSHQLIVGNLQNKEFASFYFLVEDQLIPENIENLKFYTLLDMLKDTSKLNVEFKLAISNDKLIPKEVINLASALNFCLRVEMEERIKNN